MTEQAELFLPDGADPAVKRPSGSDSAWTRVRLLSQCFERACDANPSSTAVVCGAERVSYAELDRRANRLCRFLVTRGVAPGDRVGILLDRSMDTYIALLGVIKSGATYVPLDPAFPADRLEFIVRDSALRELVTASAFADRTRRVPCAVLDLDDVRSQLAAVADTRPGVEVPRRRRATSSTPRVRPDARKE
ncbi:AMP-binding protein [Streptomyces chiangmaiensis]